MYKLTIGLEVHCKLLTDSKVFCRCRNEQDFDDLPANTHVCPVCMGLPGALPTLSKDTIIAGAALGKLLGCAQQEYSHFDRKSYFYPDLPMGYQITQFSKPLNIEGTITYHSIDYSEEKQATITEAHIECDTAKTTHFNGELLLDFNRAGTPLVEVVTAPDFHSEDEVHGFLRELQRTLKYYKISDAEMDKGQMRCDVNISISKNDTLGTKVEIKNMNSISAIKKAIQYEYQRQTVLLEAGKEIQQETRNRDDTTCITNVMRSKENALDYRYFPEPDLPILHYTTELDRASREMIGETISTKITRYKNKYGFNKEYINGILSDSSITHLFEQGTEKGYDATLLAKYIVNFILSYLNTSNLSLDFTSFDKKEFFVFLDAIQANTITDNDAKQIFTNYLASRESMQKLIDTTLANKTDSSTLDSIIHTVIADNQHVVEEYKNGKTTAIGFLIGQVMKKTSGGASPQEVQKRLQELLA